MDEPVGQDGSEALSWTMGGRTSRGGAKPRSRHGCSGGKPPSEPRSRKLKGLDLSVRCTQGRGRTADGSLAQGHAVPGWGNTRSGPLRRRVVWRRCFPTTRRRGDPPSASQPSPRHARPLLTGAGVLLFSSGVRADGGGGRRARGRARSASPECGGRVGRAVVQAWAQGGRGPETELGNTAHSTAAHGDAGCAQRSPRGLSGTHQRRLGLRRSS